MNADTTKRPIALFEPARRRSAEAEYLARQAEYDIDGTAPARLRMMIARDRWLSLFDAPMQRPRNEDQAPISPPPRPTPARAATNHAARSYLQMLDEMCVPPYQLAG